MPEKFCNFQEMTPLYNFFFPVTKYYENILEFS